MKFSDIFLLFVLASIALFFTTPVMFHEKLGVCISWVFSVTFFYIFTTAFVAAKSHEDRDKRIVQTDIQNDIYEHSYLG